MYTYIYTHIYVGYIYIHTYISGLGVRLTLILTRVQVTKCYGLDC